MTTRDLKQNIRKIGFNVQRKLGTSLLKITDDDGYSLAMVDTNSKHSFSTLYNRYDELADMQKLIILRILTEYSSTELDEREGQ